MLIFSLVEVSTWYAIIVASSLTWWPAPKFPEAAKDTSPGDTAPDTGLLVWDMRRFFPEAPEGNKGVGRDRQVPPDLESTSLKP